MLMAGVDEFTGAITPKSTKPFGRFVKTSNDSLSLFHSRAPLPTNRSLANSIYENELSNHP